MAQQNYLLSCSLNATNNNTYMHSAMLMLQQKKPAKIKMNQDWGCRCTKWKPSLLNILVFFLFGMKISLFKFNCRWIQSFCPATGWQEQYSPCYYFCPYLNKDFFFLIAGEFRKGNAAWNKNPSEFLWGSSGASEEGVPQMARSSCLGLHPAGNCSGAGGGKGASPGESNSCRGFSFLQANQLWNGPSNIIKPFLLQPLVILSHIF